MLLNETFKLVWLLGKYPLTFKFIPPKICLCESVIKSEAILALKLYLYILIFFAFSFIEV